MPVIKLEPDSEETLNRHDFWRGCYATMLSELSIEHIKEFFRDLPMVMGGRLIEGVEFYNLLWNEKGRIPMDWNYGSIHPLERFLIDKGYDALGFFRKMLHRNNRATYMPGKVLLSWFYPVMDKFFDRYDPRELVLQMITVYTEKYVEGTVHRRLKKEVDGEWMRSYMLFIGHKSFRKFYVFNFDFIVGEQIRSFPKMLDLPEFEELSYLNDCQRIEDVLWEEEFRRDAEGLYWNGRRIAVPDDYHAFMERGGFDIGAFNMPRRQVLVATEDIHCARRGRQVIYRGCAYESPAYLTVIKHRKNTKEERKILQQMLQDTMVEDDLFSPEVIRKHEELIRSLEKKLAFSYTPGDESISVNGAHLTKGVPAKILRNILHAYVKEGKNDFEYREFKRDFEISLGQKNSNFEVRFYRLVGKLGERCPELRIEKADRGRFTLAADCKVLLEEA